MARIDLNVRHALFLLALLVAAALVYVLRDTVVLLGIAIVVTTALTPVIAFAERRRLSHSWAVAATMLSLVLLPLVFVVMFSPLVVAEVQSLAKSVPTLETHADAALGHFGVAGRVNDAIAKANPAEHVSGLVVVSARQTIGLLVQAVTVVVVTGYLLSEGPHLKAVLHAFVPQVSERHIEPLLRGMEQVVGGYLRGQALTSAMFGAFAFLLCLALRVPNPLLLGVIAAIGDVIPLFGVPAAMLVAFTHSTWQALAVLGGYLIYSQLESHLILPRVYARSVNLSPLMVILATIAGGALNGIVGILIGIPIVGVIKVVFDYVVAERRRDHEEAGNLMTSGAEAMAGERIETVSPFEPIVQPESDAAVPESDTLSAASARIRRLEKQVAELAAVIASRS